MQFFLAWWLLALAGLLMTSALWVWRAESRSVTNSNSVPPAAGHAWPPLLVLCPLSAGDSVDAWRDVDFAERPPGGLLAYPGPLHVLFLADERDEKLQARVWHLTQRLQRAGLSSALLATRPAGRNHKAAQLACVLPTQTAGRLVINLDSDVAIESVDASGLVARLQAGDRPAAAWQATVPVSPVSLGDWLAHAVLTASVHAMPYVALLKQDEAVGKVLCYRPSALALAGGWSPSIARLGDDVCFSDRLKAAGERVVACRAPAAKVLRRGQSVQAVLARFVRWTRIVLEQRPALFVLYPLFVCSFPLFAVACGASVMLGTPAAVGVAAAACALALRVAMAAIVRRCCQLPAGGVLLLLDALAAEALLIAACAVALCRPRVMWHGRDLTMALACPARARAQRCDPRDAVTMTTSCATSNSDAREHSSAA